MVKGRADAIGGKPKGLLIRFFQAALALMAPWFVGCGSATIPKEETAKAVSVELPTVFHQGFRQPPDIQGQLLPDELRFHNVQVPAHLQFQPDGLLFHVPKTFIYKAGTALGLQTTFGLRGDFDVSATFKDFLAEPPPSGTGVGFGLSFDSTDGGSFQIARVVRKNNEQGIRWTWWNKKATVDSVLPCTDPEGRLGMKRIGPTLSFMWAPATQGNKFQTVYQCEFGTGDIRWLRANVFTFGMPCDVQVRMLDWTIRGQKELNPVSDPSRSPPVVPSTGPSIDAGKGGLALVLFIGLFITLSLALVLWLFVRRRKSGLELSAAPVENKP